MYKRNFLDNETIIALVNPNKGIYSSIRGNKKLKTINPLIKKERVKPEVRCYKL